ncbi:RNA 3'-terminal phosphate cyclase, partial [Candidatus Parcubacteria bacterium]|nr:RNA 3'-terminal phosphate cyclase [Candidatus Parcubacteria bacterium]
TKKPCHIFNIRSKRPNPGLQTQHLVGLRALAELSQGQLEGDFLGSKEIKFFPGEIKKERLKIKIETAGAITLILQSLIPVCLFAKNPVEIEFEGGATDTFFAPTLDYFQNVFLRILEKMGPKVEINVLKRGYYPSGEALVKVKVFPTKLKPINLTEKGNLKKISIISRASESLKERKVAERQIQGAKEILGKLNLPIETKIDYPKTTSPGSSICISCEYENTFLGSDNLGKLGIPAEEIGRKCALQILEEEKLGGCVDRFLSDQILPYMALSGEKCQVKIGKLTDHAKTNIWVIEKFFLEKFKIKENIVEWK